MPVIPKTKPYRVGRSKTGLGLFATQPIKKGTKIIRYFGPLLDSKKAEDDAIENKYLFELDKRWTIDGSIRENVARYINHSCKPNAESDVKPRKKKVVIRAIKNIAPGDEINYDYGTDYFKAYLKPIGCKCDACEKKRAKKKAEERAERARVKAKENAKDARKAEKKANKKTDELAKETAKDKAKQRAKAKAKSTSKSSASAKSDRAAAKSRRPAAGKRVKTKSSPAKTLTSRAKAA
ncbi:SET domain-containing protein [Bradyrhizobium aeschynomenes]|uniref:SET domain-containing protein n=1 Tax=Bradyrhizobium aeschynomenes TaxID=2734909 RepID=UPI001553F7EF|nr:SET domain-containing protein [Bradyrhizobium aeschynomenes]NPV25488.1 SET domain-containing protein [Bradyrhizobium aeschynomenes]